MVIRIFKWIFSWSIGLLISLSLFGFMRNLVNSGDALTDGGSDLQSINFVRLKIEDEVQVKERKRPEEPPPPKKPPPPKRMEMQEIEQPDMPAPDITIPNLDLPQVSGAGASLGGIGLQESGDGDRNSGSMLRSRIDPVYPRKAAVEGLEGSVRMRVTIGTDGRPINVEVLGFTDRIFVSSAQRAVYRWRWEPRYVDGAAVETVEVIELPFVLRK
ncbi:MAG: energy transducer TonB [Verrucomicrobiota bacterium]